MSDAAALLDAGAVACAAAVASGVLRPIDLVEASLARIAARDGSIGAFWNLDADEARQAAAQSPTGPLAGVPVAIKANIAVRGRPWHAGIAAYRDRIATADATCVARLKAAGAVIVGLVGMDEGALGASSDNAAFGRIHNPLRHGSTPGGSSGGSAAAVAVGMVAAALGTDTMGSVRLPAAYCGVMGLKPTAGLVPTDGVVPLSWTLDHVGPIARTTQDLALVTSVLAGPEPRDPASRAPPEAWTARPGPIDVAGLCLVMPTQASAAALEPAVRAAFTAAVARLRDAGAAIEIREVPDWDPGATRRAGLLLCEAEACVVHEAALRADPAGFSPGFRALLGHAERVGAVKLAEAQSRLRRAAHGIARVLDHCDAVIMPTAPQRAFPHGTAPPADQADLTAIANVAGLPALAVPLEAPPGELPGSLQILGSPWTEARVLGLGAFVSGR